MPLYHIKTNVPIFHSLTGSRADSHLHSLSIAVYLSFSGKGTLRFDRVQQMLNGCLEPYQNQFLNELPEFAGVATIEQAGEVFYRRLRDTAAEFGLTLERFEIEETPLRTYIIRNAMPGEE